MLDLPLLESLVHPRLDLLPERIHLIRLLLNESGLGGDDFFVT